MEEKKLLTKQEIFTRVRNHLLRQGVRATITFTGGSKTCVYRAPDAKACAVGCLIPSEVSPEPWEGFSVAQMTVAMQQALCGVMGVPWNAETLALLSDLQRVHDSGQAGDWAHLLRSVAIVHKVEWEPEEPDEVPA